MPNHVKNIVSFDCGENKLKEIWDKIGYDNPEHEDISGIGTIDFNKIIPMPESLDIECSSRTTKGLELYEGFVYVYTLCGTVKRELLNIPKEIEEVFLTARKDIDRDTWNVGRTAFQNKLKYGASTWYDWCVNNWGTKWNSYGYSEDRDIHSSVFDTAWSAPKPVMLKLSEIIPDVRITLQWADEDLGYNCGSAEYYNGELVCENLFENTKEAFEHALDVWDYDAKECGYLLNSTETDYVYADGEKLDAIELLGNVALITNERLNESDIPKGMYLYHIRGCDDDPMKFGTLKKSVKVNHMSSVVVNEPIDLGDNGYIEFNDDNSPSYLGTSMTLMEYADTTYEISQDMTMDMC